MTIWYLIASLIAPSGLVVWVYRLDHRVDVLEEKLHGVEALDEAIEDIGLMVRRHETALRTKGAVQ